jgi:deoxyribose-phosphate aldolase
MTPAEIATADRTAARIALACLDLTSLDDAHRRRGGEAEVERLCRRAQGPRGRVAAVCVWPRLAALARSGLPSAIAVAAVANFPDGGSDTASALRETAVIAAAGAQEVDLVLPYRDLAAAPALLAAVRRECAGLRLKVILETGELHDEALIARACRIALDGGADFLKTSTGKAAHGASPAAARVLLGAITGDAGARHRVGFKASGGIRSVADAAVYLGLTAAILGPAALTSARLRIGASSLLDDIEAVLAGVDAHVAADGGRCDY